jgi:hypothetical protein
MTNPDATRKNCGNESTVTTTPPPPPESKPNGGGLPASITVGNPLRASAFAIPQDYGDVPAAAQSPPPAAAPESKPAAGPRLVRPDEALAIPKPTAFSLDKFKSTCGPTIGGVDTLLAALPCHNLAGAKDFARLHHDVVNYWSPELTFVNVPIKGVKRDTLHLIDEAIAMRHLPSGRVLRFRLALATKPHDVFFLCHVPTTNLDNSWNLSNVIACDQARTHWLQISSRKAEGVDGYKTDYARNQAAFPAPRWPNQSLSELIEVTFAGRMIDTDNHPGLLRLVGDLQQIS